jgi:toxin ParE1/3/4
MSLNYKLSSAAADDINELLNRSVIEFGIQQTETYYHELQHCLQLLAKNPSLCISIDGYRRFPCQSHMIYYQTHSDYLWIVRVLHKRMDPIKAIQNADNALPE